jgi:hypothetical protein
MSINLTSTVRRGAVGTAVVAASVATAVATAPAAQAETIPLPALELAWTPVATNGDPIPGTTVLFNSYNQPAVNASGQVVFRARSKSGTASEPIHGVWTREMGVAGSSLRTVVDKSTAIPLTNTGATFTEFPSSPRIDMSAGTIVTRGQSTPTYEYVVGTDPTTGEPLTTKAGTSGVYVDTAGTLRPGANLLGAVPPDQLPGAGDFSVPGAQSGVPIRFDQFPSAPSVTGTTVVFKGNYTDEGVSRTGVFYRDAVAGGPTHLIANSTTVIPNQPAGGTTLFGATAPPSAAGGNAVFVGWDNEAAPTLGGIYLAPLTDTPQLQTLVGIGSQVPGEEAGATFTQFGEGLSYNGRYVGFWGSWGSETGTTIGVCPNDGNKARLAYCREHDDNVALSYSVHQGFFVYDTITGNTDVVAKTGDGNGFDNFMYWNYTGHVPGTGGTDEQSQEPPAWRASTFVAISGDARGYQAAFQATRSTGETGLYLQSPPKGIRQPAVLVDTNTLGSRIDPAAPGTVVSVGVERDGFRNGWLAITVSTLDPVTSLSWAGIYLTRINVPLSTTVTTPGIGALYPVGTAVPLTAGFSDPEVSATHSCRVDWGVPGGASVLGQVTEAGGSGTCTAATTYTDAGVYTVTATVTTDNAIGTAEIIVVVYDPSAGFVTGGGWIESPPGAYTPDGSVTGKAGFGFVSKYQKGVTAPDGNTQFVFEAAGLTFRSSSYEWLVVSGPLAQYKGEGTVSGLGAAHDGTYKFLLTARDGDLAAGGPDTFRIKIFRDDSVLYDNGTDTVLGNGSIVIHKK